MKNWFNAVVVGALSGIVIGGCGDNAPKPATAPTVSIAATRSVVSVTIGGLTNALIIGETAQLQATAAFSDGTQLDLTAQAAWQSANLSVATVTPGGLITATGGGQVDIQAVVSSQGIPGLTAPAAPNLTGTGRARVATLNGMVVLAPTQVNSVAVGASAQFIARALLSDGSAKDIASRAAWQSSNPAVVTVSASGVVTGTGVGNTDLLASYGGVTASRRVYVPLPSASVTKLSLPGTQSLFLSGESYQLSAIAVLSDSSSIDATRETAWLSTNPAAATVAGGLVTAVAPGSFQIRATYQGFTSSVSGLVATVSRVTVTGQAAYIAGGSAQLVATISTVNSQRNGSASALWQSAAPAIAAVSPTGVLTAASFGETDISATFGGKTGTMHVTVVPDCSYDGATGPENYTWEATTSGSMLIPTFAGCAWTVTSDVDWIQFTGQTSPTGLSVTGVGSGKVTFSVAEFEYSESAEPRIGNLTTKGATPGSGRVIPIYQFSGCLGRPVSTPIAFGADGGKTGDLEVLIGSSGSAPCRWRVISQADWITITGAELTLHTGDRDLFIRASPNPGMLPRVATVSAPGFTYVVTQAGRSLLNLYHPSPRR